MKKILSITLAASAALSTSAIAAVGGNGIFGDVAFINDKDTNTSVAVSQNDVNETNLGVTHRTEDGLFIGAQTTYDWNSDSSGHKATEVGIGYRFNISENFYIMPQASYTFRDHNNTDYNYALDPFATTPVEGGGEIGDTNWNSGANYDQGDSWKVGLQSAYHLDNGVFFAARYSYEQSKDSLAVGSIVVAEIEPYASGVATDPKAGFDSNVGTHEMELTVGYTIDDVAMLSASWKQTQFNDVSGYSNDHLVAEPKNIVSPSSTKFDGKSDDFEVRAAFLGFDNALPYVSFTKVGDHTIKSGALPSNLVGTSEHVLEVGISYNF